MVAAETPLGGVMTFISESGIYEIVLPFLLVFAMVFAILEKTKVFGMEEIEGKKYTRKNINAIVAFCIAFFVVGSSQLVKIILNVSAQAVVVLLCIVLALILIGAFSKEDEGYFTGPYKAIFMIIVGISLMLIILNAIQIRGTSVLNFAYQWIFQNLTSTAVAGVLLIAFIIGMMVFITSGDSIAKMLSKSKEKKE